MWLVIAFDLRIMITPLLSLNSSFIFRNQKIIHYFYVKQEEHDKTNECTSLQYFNNWLDIIQITENPQTKAQ